MYTLKPVSKMYTFVFEIQLTLLVGIYHPGCFGKVYRGIWNGTDVAIKVFLEQDLTVENIKDFCNEISILWYMFYIIFYVSIKFAANYVSTYLSDFSSSLLFCAAVFDIPMVFIIYLFFASVTFKIIFLSNRGVSRRLVVILFLGACTKPPKLSLVTEFMENGSLYHALYSTKQMKSLSWKRKLKMLRDICRYFVSTLNTSHFRFSPFQPL